MKTVRPVLGVVALLAAAGALGVPVGSASANTIYFLNPFPGAPSFSGQIVTDGTVGPITGANIVSWSYTTGSGAFSGTGLDARFEGNGTLTADATDLVFSGSGIYSAFELFHIDGAFYRDTLGWFRFDAPIPPGLTISHRGLDVANGDGFSASVPGLSSVTIASIPAPGAAGLLAIGGLLAPRRRR